MVYSVLWLIMDWTVQGSNPGAGEIFRAVETNPNAHPASCTMGSGSFSGVKQPECGADHPPPSGAGFRMGWRYTSASPVCLHGHVMG